MLKGKKFDAFTLSFSLGKRLRIYVSVQSCYNGREISFS